jgi:hypothetical protein
MTRASCRGFAAAACLAAALAAATRPALPAEESSAGILESARHYADIIRQTLPLLERRPGPAAVVAAQHDARRAVAEIDRLLANAGIFEVPMPDRQRLQALSAAAHLHLALLETHGLEFERARQEISRARAISDAVEQPEFRTEWVALQTGQPGGALLTRFNLLTLSEFESALWSAWNRARGVSFEFRGFTTQDLSLVQLQPASIPSPGSLDDRLLRRGAVLLRETLGKGRPSFTVPLPPGVYRLVGRPGGDIDRGFVVPESTEVDTVYIDRAHFALRLEQKPGLERPRLFLNGLERTDFNTLPYGVYRLKADPEIYPTAPQIVRFVLGEGIPDKTRSSWTLYVPAGVPAVLQLDRGSSGARRR